MFELLLKVAAGGKPSAGELEALRGELAGVERAVSRSNAQAQGGSSQAAKFSKLIVTGDVDLPAGVVNVGPYAPGKANAKLSAGGLQLRNYSTVKIDLQSDGDVFIGQDTAVPGSNYLAIFSNIQTYNAEAMGAGDMLIGDNSASKANIKWNKASGQLEFRSGPTIFAKMTSGGTLTFVNAANALLFEDTAGSVANGAGIDYDNSNNLDITNNHVAGQVVIAARGVGGQVNLKILTTAATVANVTWQEDPALAERAQLTLNTGTKGAKLVLADATALADTVIQTAGTGGGATQATFPGAVNVGTGVSTTAGELTVSGSATISTGLNVGAALGAAAGEILTSLTGTWTPTFNGTVTAGVFTYTAQVGYYIKIGGYVFIVGQVAISAIGTPPAGSMRIGGLPFTSAATYIGGVSFAHISNFKYTAAALQVTGVINTTATNILLRESFTNIGTVDVPAANFTNATCEFRFVGMYKY